MSENKEFEEKLKESQFKKRFSFVKAGKEAMKVGDASKASQMYKVYIDEMCNKFETNLEQIDKHHFPDTTPESELIVLSQVCYDLARISDLSKHEESNEKVSLYLGVFERLSINSRYQALNTQILRRHLSRTRFKNKKIFEECLKRINQKSSFCFIASYAFTSDSFITNHYRLIKRFLPSNFIDNYYLYSPKIIKILRTKPILNFFSKNFFFRPLLFLGFFLTFILRYVS